ncbi:MAG: TonB-dependent receptor [Ignavibacteriaceae bacterium]
MNYFSKVTLLILFFSLTILLQGQSVTLHGIVIDAKDHSPVINGVVRISQLNLYDVTDKNGEFLFENLSDNDYTIEVSHLGYKPVSKLLTSKELNNSCFIIHLYSAPVQTSTIIITGEHSDFTDEHLQHSSLKGKDLERDLGHTLASTLKNETGISIRSMGPAPARPVIRGLGNDRIFISEDGFKSGDLSSTSPDHSVAIEPFTVDRIEVIRGPKVLLFNSNSLGGVVNIVRNEIPISIPGKPQISSGIYGESANLGMLGSLIAVVPVKNFVLRGELSKRKTTDITTPIGNLQNSDIDVMNYSLGFSYIDHSNIFGASLREYESDYGIPGGFKGGHLNGVDISMFKRLITLKSELIFENNTFIRSLSLNFSRNYYRHIEYEKKDLIGAEFSVYTYNFTALLSHRDFLFFNEGNFGLSSELKDFNIGGYVFTPPTKQMNLSAYFFQKKSEENYSFELSGRIFFDKFTPRRANTSAREEFLAERTFLSYSLAAASTFPLGKNYFFGLNLSKSSRVPSIEELYSEGPHLAAYSYEIGNPNLRNEEGYGLEFFFFKKTENLFANLNLYANLMNSYIIPRNSGKTNWATLLPVYQASQVDASLLGFEIEFEFSPLPFLFLNSSVSYTYGELTGSKSPLPSIPPLKWLNEFKFSLPVFSTGVSLELVAPQNRVDIFEEPTAGYGLINAFFQYSLIYNHIAANFSLTVDNIFDKEYRNHLSRIKSIIPEVGRNFRLTVRLYY